jgi:hypothetical protein
MYLYSICAPFACSALPDRDCERCGRSWQNKLDEIEMNKNTRKIDIVINESDNSSVDNGKDTNEKNW